MMFEFTNMSEVVITLGMLVEVADGVSDRDTWGF